MAAATFILFKIIALPLHLKITLMFNRHLGFRQTIGGLVVTSLVISNNKNF
jgi:ABC-type protease/lipase transport system fused ATPase/permease subunit